MAEIVNLGQARKARKRDEAARAAAENRARFGRTKAEKARESLEADARGRLMDGARIERDD